jgi:filamentous hemagglutinin family protein
MNGSPSNLLLRREWMLPLVAFGLVVFPSIARSAPGVVLDGSMGPQGALPGPNFLITASMGQQIGPNLFHSFSDFNLTSSQSATFTGPAQIQNIIARVTGGNPSSIDGSINSQIAGANLFLLNPSGVMFGPHAQVNVTGAFTASTANYVKLAGGGKFNTSLGGSDVLTSAPVSAFGFLGAHPAPVQMNGTYLAVNPHQSLNVIAGDVTFNNTELDAPSGNLTVFSAGGAGEVPFSLTSPGSGYASASNASFGTVSLTNASYLDIDGDGGGNVIMRAGQLTVDYSTISSYNTGANLGGKISLQADQVTVVDGSEIVSAAAGTGNAGDIAIQAGSLTVDGTNDPAGTESAILSFSLSTGTGGAGSVHVAATGAVDLLNGGQIATSTNGPGGNVSIQADSMTVDGSAAPSEVTGISTQSFGTGSGIGGLVEIDIVQAMSVVNGGSIQSSTFGGGNAGSITANVGGALTLNNEAGISSSTFGDAAAGDIMIQADSMSVANLSNVLSYSQPSGNIPNSGNAGSVNVAVNQALLIQSGGLIGSETGSDGSAGSVGVQAGSLTIQGAGNAALFTGITNQAGSGSTGNAGSVVVHVVNALTIQNGGAISSNTFAAGNGSDVGVHAGSLDIDGEGASNLTGIAATSNTGATGDGGTLAVAVDGGATLTGGGEISSTTFSSGNSGSLTVNVGGGLSLTDGGEISGGTFSSGASGQVSVHSASLTINSEGSTSALTGISDQSGAGATGNGGPITVSVDGALVLANGGEISSGTHSLANGGNVTVQAGSLTIEDAMGSSHLTGITSETDGTSDSQGHLTGLGGNAGAVNVLVSGELTITSGKIDTDTFASGNAGNVSVQAGSVDIDGSSYPTSLTGIYSDSNGYVGDTTGEGGNAGTVSVIVGGELNLSGTGKIGAATLTSGLGGDVDIQAGSVAIDGASSGITAQALGLGNSGSVLVSAGNVSVTNGGIITTSSRYSNAGSIVINANDSLILQSGSSITTAAALDGGDITLNVGTLVYLLHSQITAAAGYNGGNILIDPEFVVLNDSLISANAALGQGGNITIISDYFFNSNSQITATGSTTNGTITISAPELDLAGNLLLLPGDLVQAEKELRERCARSLNHEFSSLTVVGRGGVETPPDELQPDFGVDSLGDSRNAVP